MWRDPLFAISIVAGPIIMKLGLKVEDVILLISTY